MLNCLFYLKYLAKTLCDLETIWALVPSEELMKALVSAMGKRCHAVEECDLL